MKFASTLLCGVLLVFAAPRVSFAESRKQKAQEQYDSLVNAFNQLKVQYGAAHDSTVMLMGKIQILSTQLNDEDAQLKEQRANNEEILKNVKNLSAISGSQAESIKQSMDNMGAKDAYIRNVQTAISRQDSINLALVVGLQGALGKTYEGDADVRNENGLVVVSISDKLLFKNTKYTLNPAAKDILSKIAEVLSANPEAVFTVEGNTDNSPYKEGLLADNWDLSVKRAAAVVRSMQKDLGVPPERATAAGKGEFAPIAGNDSDAGRAQNRRTRIIIAAQPDQYYRILQKAKQ